MATTPSTSQPQAYSTTLNPDSCQPLDGQSSSSLVSFNIVAQAPLKLTPTNYLSWRLQFTTLLTGYDLLGYVDGTLPCPPSTTTVNNTPTPNPAYHSWIRQDQLILNALIGSISPTLISFIAIAQTSHDAWHTLATTYSKPSRGRITQLKTQLHQLHKGTHTITDFLQLIKSKVDELALMNTPTDPEDLTLRILHGLGPEYQELANAIQARDTGISFDELHEKLLTREAQLLSTVPTPSPLPITANIATRPFPMQRSSPRPFASPSSLTPHAPCPYLGYCQLCAQQGHTAKRCPMHFPAARDARPYLGRCQLCDQTGHSAKRCSTFNPSSWSSRSPSSPPPRPFSPPPQAHTASSVPAPSASECILDSGATHHVTTDLSNLSLHFPYEGSDDVIVGNGTGLRISHKGTLCPPSTSSVLKFPSALCVPSMANNLLSVSQLCINNDVRVVFTPTHFQVQDPYSGTILHQCPLKNGVC